MFGSIFALFRLFDIKNLAYEKDDFMGVMFSVGARYVELRRLGFSHGGCCGGYGIPALCGDDSGGGRPGDYDGFDVEAGGGFDGG